MLRHSATEDVMDGVCVGELQRSEDGRLKEPLVRSHRVFHAGC